LAPAWRVSNGLPGGFGVTPLGKLVPFGKNAFAADGLLGHIPKNFFNDFESKVLPRTRAL